MLCKSSTVTSLITYWFCSRYFRMAGRLDAKLANKAAQALLDYTSEKKSGAEKAHDSFNCASCRSRC